jgi:single-strand DNA-binding protein
MKNITIAGRCTKDAELRNTQEGKQVAGFSVAVDDGYGANKSTMFFDCSIWGVRADKLAPMLTKGKQVTVSGDLGQREYNGKTYLTLRVYDVDLQGGGQRDDAGGGYAQRPAAQGNVDNGGAYADGPDGDTIPF